jgi:hypothetical protein
MPIIDTPAGTLEVTNAILSASEFRATQKISVSNSAPTKNFSVGDKFHVSTTDADAVNITGNLVAQKLKIGNLLVSPTFDLAAVSNVGNTTSNTLQFANATTSFVASSNVEIGGNITLTSNAQVKVGSNVLAEYTGPHGREPKEMPLKKFPEIAFEEGKFDSNPTTNTYTQAGYTVTASTEYSVGYAVHNTFNDVLQDIEAGPSGLLWTSATSTYPASGGFYVGTTYGIGTTYGEFIKLELPYKIKPKQVRIFPRTFQGGGAGNAQSPAQFKIFGSNDNFSSEIVELYHQNTDWVNNETWGVFDISHTTHFKHFGIVFTKTNGTNIVGVQEIEYYGYEEPAPLGDLSLDTTLKSTFNSVRSNNYVMYFDGKYFVPGDGGTSNNLVTGSNKSVIHHNATYDSTGKYWTLDGSTESNVTTGSLGFEGDVPHTVSTWINASNLEANALTQQLFSIGSGYDKSFLKVDDTQIAANTWHNVTYAYQGEGGSKVTYVDGRKVEEAQVEDTFGEYPPFNMTQRSQSGYTVDESSHAYGGYDGIWSGWKAFDGVPTGNTNIWHSQGGFSGSSPYGAVGNSRGLFAGHSGEWLRIAMPHKIIVSYIVLRGRDGFPTQLPASFKVLGSNTNKDTPSDWDVIHTTTNAGMSDTVEKSFSINATKAYKYYVLVVTSLAGSYQNVGLSKVQYYGHKEGDLTRFPEPTRVLKYPHVTMTGPAQRGYVASASSYYNTGVKPEHPFINEWVSQSNSWQSGPLGNNTTTGDGRYTAGSTFNTAYLSNTPLYGEGGFQTSELSNTWTGEWLQIELPYNLKTTQHVFRNADGNSGWNDSIPTSGVILGSTNGSTWNLIHQFSSTLKDQTIDVSHTTYYKYFRVVGTAVGSSTVILIPEWELYGTQEDTETPLIVGGPFAGKVANFRVYDQYLGDERIQEIYDAQKDAFGHKKSSMTFYKGRIGVGTTEPEGALTVIDEPHALQKFPARAVSADDSYVEGDGQIKLSAAGGSGYQAFDGLTSTSWAATPTRNTRLSEEVDFGAWLKIQTHEPMSLKKAEIESKAAWNQVGGDFLGGAVSTEFGRGNSVSHDGTRAVLCSLVSGGTSEGFVRVYDWNGSSWVQVGQQIDGSTGTSGAGFFGRQNHVSGDGNYIVAAESVEGGANGSQAGKVHVYYLVGATWTILPDSGSLTNSGDIFEGSSSFSKLGGGGVRLSYDGQILAITDTGYDDISVGVNAGRVDVYYRSNGAWLIRGSATDIIGEASGDYFGFSMDMSEDGNHIIVSMKADLSDRATYVKVYKWDGSNYSLKGTKLTYPGGASVVDDRFGNYVSISNDGNTIAISAERADSGSDGSLGTNVGAVYMFTYDDSASNWVLKDTLLPRDEGTNQQFGAMNCLSGDGQRVLVSAVDNISGNAAYVVIHEKDGDNWKLRQPSDSGNAGVTGDFGLTTASANGYKYLGTGSLGEDKTLSLSRDGSTIIVCDPYITSGYSREGRVRIFNMPSNIKSIWGSNDDVNWTKITTAPTREEATSNVAGLAFGYDDRLEFKNLDNPNYYKYHAIVADAFTRLKDIKLFGVRNQGSSTLHDGALTLTKNLDVPRIGPPLDADDTPRRDRLVVEYNTSTNPVEDGLVQDTSGRGNDGKMYGNTKYNATEKAFEFDGTDDMLDIPVPRHMLGDPEATVSIWVKPTLLATAGSDWDMFAHVGRNVSGSQFQLTYNGDTKLHIGGYDQNIRITGDYPLAVGTWYHLCMTVIPGAWSTTTKKLYINGQQITNTYLEGSGTTNIPDHPQSRISFGGLRGTGDAIDHESHCKMSNMKVYDTALTAEEVKTLYDMGRTGSVANPQPLHIAAPLYSPGTIVQVDQVFTNNLGISTTSTSPIDITGLSITIQPKFANSKILVSYQLAIGSNYHAFVHIKRTQNGVTSYDVGRGAGSGFRQRASSYVSHLNSSHVCSENMEFLDSANGIDPITYQIQMWVASSSYIFILNRSISYGNSEYFATLGSSLTVKEICQ